ncbi:MAG: FmdE family protein [bacterium]
MERLKEALENAGKIHGHICPSLFYGVSLALKLKDVIHAEEGEDYTLVLEGKSVCIRDGVQSVFGQMSHLTVKDTGECAIEASFDHRKYRIRLLDSVRAKINEFHSQYPLLEFRKKGVDYLFSLKEEELFHF